MKKFIQLIALSAGLVFGLSGAAVAAPVKPAECTGTYTKTIEGGSASAIAGTAGNDLIFAGDSNSIDGKGGNDCIVAGAVNAIEGNGGDDVIILKGWGNTTNAGAGNDKVYDKSPGGQQINGNGGNDYLSGSGNSTVNGGAGNDECYKGTNGTISNCELPVAPAVAVDVPWWVTLWGL